MCDDAISVGLTCKKHNIMLCEIVDHKHFDTLKQEVLEGSDEYKKTYKRLMITMNVLNAMTHDERLQYYINQMLTHKLDIKLFTGIFMFIAMHCDIDATMENIERLMEHGEITEGFYLHTCDVLKLYHEARLEYNKKAASSIDRV